MGAAQVSGPAATPKGLHHSFGIAAVAAAIPLMMIQKRMGHSSLLTTAIYLDASGTEERRIAFRLWRWELRRLLDFPRGSAPGLYDSGILNWALPQFWCRSGSAGGKKSRLVGQHARSQQFEPGAAIHLALMSLSRFTCPSTGPLLQGSVTAAATAGQSRFNPPANLAMEGNPSFWTSFIQALSSGGRPPRARCESLPPSRARAADGGRIDKWTIRRSSSGFKDSARRVTRMATRRGDIVLAAARQALWLCLDALSPPLGDELSHHAPAAAVALPLDFAPQLRAVLTTCPPTPFQVPLKTIQPRRTLGRLAFRKAVGAQPTPHDLAIEAELCGDRLLGKRMAVELDRLFIVLEPAPATLLG